MAKIKNMNEVLESIVTMMMQHDKDHTRYQEDIYLYMQEDGTASVKLFANVGGNSWIDDDHYTVARLHEAYGDWSDCFTTICDIADAIGWSKQTLLEHAAAWYSETYDDPADASDMSYGDVRDFIKAHEPLQDQITAAEADELENHRSEYAERAQMALDGVLEEMEEREAASNDTDN